MSAGVLIVSPATTGGWVTVESELAGSLQRLEVPYAIERVTLGPERHLRRAWPLVDLVEAAGARRALARGLRAYRPQAVILLTATASLLAPIERLTGRAVAVAIRLDCPAAVNRPGIANLVQRRLERRRLRQADVILAMGPRSAALVQHAGARDGAISLPTAIEVQGAGPASPVTPYALAYTPDPHKKGLDRICAAWEALGERRRGAVLRVASIEAGAARDFLADRGLAEPAGVEWLGGLDRDRYLEIMRDAHAFVSASRREDHGIAQLEALAAGVPLATTPSTGAYEAEPIARELQPELVAESGRPDDLARAIATALTMPHDHRATYRAKATDLMTPFGREAVDRIVSEQVLPALGLRPAS